MAIPPANSPVYPYQKKQLDTTEVTVTQGAQQANLEVLVDKTGTVVVPPAGVVLSPLPANDTRR